ncbi:BTB and MATH domain-containing protein 15 [Aphelenchoides avenae]|nr:BTB and MATH domain-containing protein 15 [Aphelenchus avenae]
MSNAGREHGLISMTIDAAKRYFHTIPPEEHERRSPPVTLCGAKWELRVLRQMVEGTPHVGIFVFRSDADQAASPWSFKVRAVMRVRRLLGGGEDSVKQFSQTLSDRKTHYGYPNVMKLEELLDSEEGFIKNNSVTIVASIMVSALAASEAVDGINGIKRRCTDVKITVGDRHFYASKGSLAVHCDYFSARFYGEVGQRDDGDIQFADMDPNDFATFLKVILSSETVDAGNIAAVMPLANYFGARTVVERCEEIIVNDMNFRDQILILDKCGISDLKNQLFFGVLEDELEEVAGDEALSKLSSETKDLIIKELLRRRKPT